MRRKLFVGILIIFGAVFLLLNFLTPLLSDDYRYAYSFATGERMTSLSQLLPSLAAHYRDFNGRVVVHFFTQLMLIIGKPAFNILNSGMAVMLLLALYRLCKGEQKYDCWLLAALAALVLLFAPVPGQTMLWLDGACNYLWGTVLILWILVPCRDAALGVGRAPSGWLLPLWLAGCLLMGATSENTSPAAVLMMLLVIGLNIRRKRRTGAWIWLGALLACAGWVFMAVSPGTLYRIGVDGGVAGASLMGQLLMNAQAAVDMLMNEAMIPCCIYLVLLTLSIFMKASRERMLASAFLFICGLAANFAMTAVAFYPARAMMGSAMLLLGASGMLIPGLTQGRFAPAIASGVVCAAFAAALTFMSVLPGSYSLYKQYNTRLSTIAAERDAGNMNITTYNIMGKSKYDAFYQNTDITDDAVYWPNVYFAKYYGLDSVVIDEYR